MKIFINSLEPLFDSISAIKTPDDKKLAKKGEKLSKPSKNSETPKVVKTSKHSKKPKKSEVEEVMGGQMEEEPSDSDRKMSAIESEGGADSEPSGQEGSPDQGIVTPQTEQPFQLSTIAPKTINYNPIPNVDTLIADNLHTKVVMVIKSPKADYGMGNNQQGIILERTDFIPFKNALLRAQLRLDSNKSKVFKVNIQLSTGEYCFVYDPSTKILNMYMVEGTNNRTTPRLTLTNEALQTFILRFS